MKSFERMPMLTELEYVQCVREQLPALAIRSARLNSPEHGQFNAILFVNEHSGSDALVFRFPRVAAALDDLAAEIRVLRALHGHTPVPVPNPVYVSADLHTLGRAFMGYRKLPGEPMFPEAVAALSAAQRDTLAMQLADFLKTLHSLDHRAIGLALPVDDSRSYWRTMLADFETLVFPHMRQAACEAARAEFDAFLTNPENFSYQPVLTHTDFGGGNILFDPSTCKVTAVIDWAGAGLGDPAVDAAASEYLGEGMFACMLEIYPALADMLPRARFYQSTFVLQEALHATRGGDNETFWAAIAEYM